MENTVNKAPGLAGQEEKSLNDEISELISNLDNIKEKLQKKDVGNSIDLLIGKLTDELQEKTQKDENGNSRKS